MKKPRHEDRGSLCAMRARSQGLDARGETRELARDGIAADHLPRDAALQLRLHRLEGLGRRLLVAARDRELGLADEGAQAAHALAVDLLPRFVSPDPLLSRLMLSHKTPDQNVYRRTLEQARAAVAKNPHPERPPARGRAL